MNIQVEKHHGRVPVTVLRLEGRIHLGNAGELKEKAQREYDQGARNMLLELSELQSLTSEGLRIIHGIYLLFTSEKQEGGPQKSAHLKLANPTNDIRRMLNIVGYDMFLDIYDDLDEAVASF